MVQEYEREFWKLKKENYDLRKLSFEFQDRLKQQEDQIRMIGNQLIEKEQVVSEQFAERT